jgi:hypothetical protein
LNLVANELAGRGVCQELQGLGFGLAFSYDGHIAQAIDLGADDYRVRKIALKKLDYTI